MPTYIFFENIKNQMVGAYYKCTHQKKSFALNLML